MSLASMPLWQHGFTGGKLSQGPGACLGAAPLGRDVSLQVGLQVLCRRGPCQPVPDWPGSQITAPGLLAAESFFPRMRFGARPSFAALRSLLPAVAAALGCEPPAEGLVGCGPKNSLGFTGGFAAGAEAAAASWPAWPSRYSVVQAQAQQHLLACTHCQLVMLQLCFALYGKIVGEWRAP